MMEKKKKEITKKHQPPPRYYFRLHDPIAEGAVCATTTPVQLSFAISGERAIPSSGKGVRHKSSKQVADIDGWWM